jgi:DNA-binding MarR family transcriptional regulator
LETLHGGAGSVVGHVYRLVRDLKAATDRELAPLGVTTQQAGLLLLARSCEGAGVSNLAEAMGGDAAGVTRLVDRLEAKGLVSRGTTPKDRRAVTIALTAAGEQLVPQLREAFHRAHERLLQGLSDDDVTRLNLLVARLRSNLVRPEC